MNKQEFARNRQLAEDSIHQCFALKKEVAKMCLDLMNNYEALEHDPNIESIFLNIQAASSKTMEALNLIQAVANEQAP